MEYADKTLTCLDCGMSFTFSASEQEFFANKAQTLPGVPGGQEEAALRRLSK
jgi:hypothetical protein